MKVDPVLHGIDILQNLEENYIKTPQIIFMSVLTYISDYSEDSCIMLKVVCSTHSVLFRLLQSIVHSHFISTG